MKAYSLLSLATRNDSADQSSKRHLRTTKKYCTEKGLALDDTYPTDILPSGFTSPQQTNRTALDTLSRDIKSGAVDTPCVILLDDIASNDGQKTNLLLKLILLGVEFHSPSSQQIFKQGGHELADIALSLISFGRWQSERRVKSLRAKQSRKRL